MNQILFVGVLKIYLEVSSQAFSATAPPLALQSQELSEEEQVVRYAAGFLPMSLLKKHEKGSRQISRICQTN